MGQYTYVDVHSEREYDEALGFFEQLGLKWGSGAEPRNLSYWHLYEVQGCATFAVHKQNNYFVHEPGHKGITLTEYRALHGCPEEDNVSDMTSIC